MARALAFAVALMTASATLSDAQPPYLAVEVDWFIPSAGVALPAEYRSALAGDIAREISVAFPTVIIVAQGAAASASRPVLRISGVVNQFMPENHSKLPWMSLSPGAATFAAQVTIADSDRGPALLWLEIQGSAQSIARKITRVCKAKQLIQPN